MHKAFSHPARIQILRELKNSDGLFVHDLTRRLPLGRPAVSGHLQILLDTKFIDVQEHGRYNLYLMNGDSVHEFLREFSTCAGELLS